MTIAIYRSVHAEAENAHKAKRRFSVSGVLAELDVSSSGYYWVTRTPSKTGPTSQRDEEKDSNNLQRFKANLWGSEDCSSHAATR